MKRFFAGFLFFLFILQGTVCQLFLPQAWGSSFVLIPQFVLSGIVVLSFYLDKREVLLFGFGFGLLYDLIYGPAIGISAFTTALVAYGTEFISKQFPPSSWVTGLIAFLAQFVHLCMLYIWYWLFDFTQEELLSALIKDIFPSVCFNLACGYPIYLVICWIYRKNSVKTIQLFG